MSAAKPVVELANLHKRFEAAVALNNVSLRIAARERLAIVGPSGAGKSTLLRIIAGLEKQDSGSLHFAGKDCSNLPAHERGISMVFQDYAVYPGITAQQNLLASLQRSSLSRSECKSKVEAVAARLKITDQLKRLPSQLSGGQLQRLALAKALLREPTLLLLDEPLSQVDIQLRQELRDLLAEVQSGSDLAIMMVTHDACDALQFASRVVVLERGCVTQDGAPQDLKAQPATSFVRSLVQSA